MSDLAFSKRDRRTLSKLAIVNGVVRFVLVSNPRGTAATYAHWLLPAHTVTLCRDKRGAKASSWDGPRAMCERCASARATLEASVQRSYLGQEIVFIPTAIPGGTLL